MSVKSKNTQNVEISVEERYTSMTDHEHILQLPDTYIGGIEEDTIKMWVLKEMEDGTAKIVYDQIKYIPGLYKIFDEILVNARDQRIKDDTCNTLDVTINEETGTISMMNNGDGKDSIPVVIHKEENCYVPEMIFGRIRTSGNYKQKGKIVGGKNGIGAKATNIYSKEFIVEIKDVKNGLLYKQRFYNNMYGKEDPIIETIKKAKTGSYVKITFTPDYQKFGVDSLSSDMVSLFKKRVYDVASVTNVNVTLNGEKIKMKSFEDYINMYYEQIPNVIYEQSNERWRVGVVFDQHSGYRQVSYVNGICTFKGGSHVTHVVDQIAGSVYNMIIAKNKNLKIKQSTIRDNLTFFIDCIIEDPGFSSQTKEELTNKVATFGSKYEVSEKFIKELSKTGIVEEVVNFAKFRAMEDLKKTDGKKKENLKGLAKLEDARWAGTRKSKYTRLILTEGDSAKAFAMAGLSVIGRDKYGVFPLKGKLLNVREATPKQLMENEEIKNIKKIIGLKHAKVYKNVSQLRYGGIIILTDQDPDGSHIKGLIMNFIHFFWPSLLIKNHSFIQTIQTPIIKVWKKTEKGKTEPIIFYTLSEYHKFKDTTIDFNTKWGFKYYKGLGTSTDDEAKEAFIDFDNKIQTYIWENSSNIQNNEKDDDDDINEDENDDDDKSVVSTSETEEDDDIQDKLSKSNKAIILAFSKDMSHNRKDWLKGYDKDDILDSNDRLIRYSDFVNKDLIHFSNYDNIRSIPSICDGFKPSQRKILYGSMLKKIFKEEIKVSQLAGYISDKTAYHHGEASLMGAIISMAQDFVGSNNLNLLLPNGNFGNRVQGGKNSASPRYIFTQLNELVPYIFVNKDEYIYEYVDDDGTPVEPVTYHPIFPTVLMNGPEGIGTGWSTSIPCYNPRDIIANLRLIINGKKPQEMTPWYRGFTGQMIKKKDKTYLSSGIYEIMDANTLEIRELPIGTWTEDYKAFLESLVADDPKNPKNSILKKFENDSGNHTIKLNLTFIDGCLKELDKKGLIEKTLKLTSSITTSNIHLYDYNNQIKKYDSVEDIMIDFYNNRIKVYAKRKEYYLKIIMNDINLLSWKIKFITDVVNGDIIVFNKNSARSKADVLKECEKMGYPRLSSNPDKTDDELSYDYITNMPLFALTVDENHKLKEKYNSKLQEYQQYGDTPLEQIWISELDDFEKAYNIWIDKYDNKIKPTKGKKKVIKTKK